MRSLRVYLHIRSSPSKRAILHDIATADLVMPPRVAVPIYHLVTKIMFAAVTLDYLRTLPVDIIVAAANIARALGLVN